MSVIDSHTHFFSLSFFETLIQQLDCQESSKDVLTALSKRASLDIPNTNIEKHTQCWLDEMKKHHVDHMVTFASLPEELESVAEAIKISKGKLTGFVLVNPQNEKSQQLIKRAHQLGFKGTLLFPVMHHFHASDEKVIQTLEAAAHHEMIVTIHFGLLQIKLRDLLGLPRIYDYRYANPLDLIPTANRFPKTPFVIPHFGCGFFRETLMVGSQCENVCVDTSSSNSWIHTQSLALTLQDVFRQALQVFGSQRILFGTDSSTFPRGWRNDIYQEQKQICDTLQISTPDQEAIFSGNIARLLNLKKEKVV